VPAGAERHAVVIDEGEVVATVELDHPLVLAPGVGAGLAAVAVMDVVVHDAAVDHRTLLLLLVELRVPLALGDVLGAGQQVKGLEGVEEGGRDLTAGALPGWREPVHAAGPASHHQAKLGQASASGARTALPAASVATTL
jgi:hypothetical protein